MTPIEKILQGAAAGKYGDDSDAIGKLAGILMSARFEQGYGPFISGVCGERGADGHYEGYIISPAYGADARCSAIFKRPGADRTSHLPETQSLQRKRDTPQHPQNRPR